MSSRSRQKARTAAQRRKSLPLFPILIALVVVIGVVVVAVAAGSGGDDDDDGVAQTRPVTLEGDALAPFTGEGDDPALGQRAPTITGEDFAGRPVTIGPDGSAKAVAFVAHWCPHCQAEVPRIAAWLSDHELPDGVELYFVSTRVSPNDGNYPPSEWLEREGVGAVPTVVDDDEFSALSAFGAGGFPYLVYLDTDNRVVLRTSGEYGDDPEVYTGLFDALASGTQPVDPR